MRQILATLALVFGLSAVAHAHPGWGIVVDGAGNVFYTDLKQVWKIEPSGKKSVGVPSVHTHELLLDAGGNLYGEHLWYEAARDEWWRRVWQLSPQGRLSELIPAARLEAEWWSGALRDFTFVQDAAGNMYWPAGEPGPEQTLVKKRAPDGSITTLAGGAARPGDGHGAAAGFSALGRMTVGPDGNLYVMDAGALRRVSPAGDVRTRARGLDEKSLTTFDVGPLHRVMGLAADALGNVYVANYGARQVKKVGPDGKVTVFLRSRLPWSPAGVAVSGNTVYVLEYAINRVRVRKVTAEGRVTTLP